MGIVYNDESEYAKELKKWNTPKRHGGFGPDGYERYPQMLYKAFRDENGQTKCMEPPPQAYEFLTMPEFMRAEARAMAFTNKCQITVKNDAEYDRARADGWRDTSAEAIAYFEALQRDIAEAAAEEQFRVRKMSGKAQAEFDAAQAATDGHVPDPAAPKKRPYRRKIAPAVPA